VLGAKAVRFFQDISMVHAVINNIVRTNPLKTKRRLLYLKTQFVPRSKQCTSPL